MRNWWKRSLVLCLTLLMTLTPWAASWAEQTTATGQITATVQLDAEGLAEAIRLVEPDWDEEDQQLLACLTALANAARLEYVYAQDGSWIRAGIYLSDQEIWYSLTEEREDGIYQTSSLYSGVVLRYSAGTYSDLQAVAEAMPWGDIAKFVSYDAQAWLDSQRMTVEEKGSYQTEVLSDADTLRSYQITDRDLAVLMDAWLYTLLDQEQIGEAFDVAFGEIETFSDFVAELIFHNHETAMDNRNLYQMDLYEKDGANVGLSVSRVGGDAQTKAMKKAAKTIRLDLSQYREMESFTQFASDLDESTKKLLAYGQGLTRMLRQKQFRPYKQYEQVILLVAGLSHTFAEIPAEKLDGFLPLLLRHFADTQGALCRTIEQTGLLSDEQQAQIVEIAKAFVKENFQS